MACVDYYQRNHGISGQVGHVTGMGGRRSKEVDRLTAGLNKANTLGELQSGTPQGACCSNIRVVRHPSLDLSDSNIARTSCTFFP